MNSLNSILLEGNLTADPEYLETKGGNKLCTFSIACNKFFKQDDEYQKEVSFLNVTVWNRLAETCNTYLKKGRGVRVVGRLKQVTWKTADGDSKSRIYIIGDYVEFKPEYNKESEK